MNRSRGRWRACAGLLALSQAVSAPAMQAAEDGFVSLFDGTSLAGWQASENQASFRVVDGAIVCDGPRSHLFYVGRDGQAAFEDFEAVAEVKARAGANSGFYFHTAFQEKDWPAQGFEVQVNNSQQRHGDYLELKMSGSLYGIRNVYKALAADDEWFTPRVEVRVNDALVVDWTEPASLPEGAPKLKRLGRGTFALQCHDPGSKVFYRNLRVRPLPRAAADPAPPASVDERYVRMLELGRANFPLVDWSYPLAMQKALDLKWQDMFVPGHHPSRAQRE